MIANVNMSHSTSFSAGLLPRSDKSTNFGWYPLPNEIRVSIKNDLYDPLKEKPRRGRLHEALMRYNDAYQELAAPR
jgi:hypothetical protein